MGISVSVGGDIGRGREAPFPVELWPKSRCVWICRPALRGVGGCGDTIAGCACGAAVSRGWSEALYWKAGELVDP